MKDEQTLVTTISCYSFLPIFHLSFLISVSSHLCHSFFLSFCSLPFILSFLYLSFLSFLFLHFLPAFRRFLFFLPCFPSSIVSFSHLKHERSHQVESYRTTFEHRNISLFLIAKKSALTTEMFGLRSESGWRPWHGTVSDFWGTVAPFIHHMLSRSCICTDERGNKASCAWWAPNFDVLYGPREKITPRKSYVCKDGTSADILRSFSNNSMGIDRCKLQLGVNNSSDI